MLFVRAYIYVYTYIYIPVYFDINLNYFRFLPFLNKLEHQDEKNKTLYKKKASIEVGCHHQKIYIVYICTEIYFSTKPNVPPQTCQHVPAG